MTTVQLTWIILGALALAYSFYLNLQEGRDAGSC